MEITEIGIVGSGVMACQIAELFLKYGFKVTLCSRSDKVANSFLEKIKDKELAGKLSTTANLEDLKGNDLIIECVKEDLKIKQEIFEKLDKIAKKSAIIASNTSSLQISKISQNCRNKKNILGLHFFNPAAHMKLVEIAKTDSVSEQTLQIIIDLAKKLEKEPIVVNDTPGFILNRILFAMLNESANLLHRGIAARDEIDKAMVLGALHPIGPLKIIDLVGVDVTVDILKNLQYELKDGKFEPSPILLQMLKENRLGRKTKKGFYDY